MGLFDGIVGMKEVKKIKKGEQGNLTKSQLTNMLINLQDAKKNLSERNFKTLYKIYNENIKDNETIRILNQEHYVYEAQKIINKYTIVGSYDLFDGNISKNINREQISLNEFVNYIIICIIEQEKQEKSFEEFENIIIDINEISTEMSSEGIIFLYLLIREISKYETLLDGEYLKYYDSDFKSNLKKCLKMNWNFDDESINEMIEDLDIVSEKFYYYENNKLDYEDARTLEKCFSDFVKCFCEEFYINTTEKIDKLISIIISKVVSNRNNVIKRYYI